MIADSELFMLKTITAVANREPPRQAGNHANTLSSRPEPSEASEVESLPLNEAEGEMLLGPALLARFGHEIAERLGADLPRAFKRIVEVGRHT
jgi:hypothetical protein